MKINSKNLWLILLVFVHLHLIWAETIPRSGQNSSLKTKQDESDLSNLLVPNDENTKDKSSESTGDYQTNTEETSQGNQVTVLEDLYERNYSLRSIGSLNVTNRRGSIQVIGWPLDKIKVTAKKTVTGKNPEQAKKLIATSDFLYREQDNKIEILARYGQGLDIEEKLRERSEARGRIDFVIRAPSKLDLKIWSVKGGIAVRSWNGPVEVRGFSGPLKIDDVSGPKILAMCPNCETFLDDVVGDLRLIGGEKDVTLRGLKGDKIFVQTTSGNVSVSASSGNQTYVTTNGNINGDLLSGNLSFKSSRGEVNLKSISGFVSGKTGLGSISIEMKKWKFFDKAFVESSKGSIRLVLPPTFSGDVDIQSVFGKTFVQFPVVERKKKIVYGPEPANHLVGSIANGTEQLKIFSYRGDIQVLKGI